MSSYTIAINIRHLFTNTVKLLPVFLVITVSPMAQSFGQNDSLFRLANKYYQHNEFNLAIATYQQIIDKGNQASKREAKPNSL